MATQITIIGGGVIGMLSALELSRAGARVRLLEKQRTGGESSWAGGGILSPLYPWRFPEPVTRLAEWSQTRYPALVDELQALGGIDPEYVRNGLLILDADERAEAEAWAAAHHRELEYRSGDLHDLEPALAAGYQAGLWMPGIGQVRNPRLVKALRAALEHLGVEIRENVSVRGFVLQGRRVTGVETDRGREPVERVAVAGGAWTAGLLQGTGWTPPVEPVRGQMILFRGEVGQIQRIVLAGGHYIIPRRDGRVLAGSTLEYVGFDKTTTEQALDELKTQAAALIPSLADSPVEHHWAGLRPGSPQGIPAVGRHPLLENLYVSTGHFRNGVVLAPASARLLCDLVLEAPPILPPAPYDPENYMETMQE